MKCFCIRRFCECPSFSTYLLFWIEVLQWMLFLSSEVHWDWEASREMRGWKRWGLRWDLPMRLRQAMSRAARPGGSPAWPRALALVTSWVCVGWEDAVLRSRALTVLQRLTPGLWVGDWQRAEVAVFTGWDSICQWRTCWPPSWEFKGRTPVLGNFRNKCLNPRWLLLSRSVVSDSDPMDCM